LAISDVHAQVRLSKGKAVGEEASGRGYAGAVGKTLVLFWRLLRYRVAVMVVIFTLLGAASHDGLSSLHWSLVTGILALMASYASATSVNDIADERIDAINHPGDHGRPLVIGIASKRDLWAVFSFSALAAVLLPIASGAIGVAALVATSVAVGIIYSLPPLILSHRTYLAPIALTVAYVGIPYCVGVVAVGGMPGPSDAPLVGALCLLFLGRIVLKDFRDREGDAAYGKPTFLLRYGKCATCLLSATCVCAADAVLIHAVAASHASYGWWLALIIQLYVLGIAAMLLRLYAADDRRGEQVSIGVGARVGNGLLLLLLGASLLARQEGVGVSPEVAMPAFALAISAFYAADLFLFLRYPERAVIGYKG
jgi:4-hydroxybenzoate polyprenyltransferase